MGVHLQSASQEIRRLNNNCIAGPFIRGIVLCSCGSTGRVTSSVNRLKKLVEMDIFDFVLSFAGVYTVDSLVVPALGRFVENVYIYDMDPWTALVQSFGEDKHALNSTPVMLSFAQFRTLPNNTQQRVVDTRVLAYSNFPDARPWGLDMYRCSNKCCGALAHDMTFYPDGKQWYGKRWLDTEMKTTCMKCKQTQRKLSAPSWVYACPGENLGRVWYRWPLSLAQRMDIGITE
ncbi:uncharacterized protein EDB91DRAFT_1064873 [Suillus paluster]|uniref:uncharacterized protein n=1 Tax=Suillus paluster TaxID=48578 RepID=UPI001B8682C5|nr:uncharacterized protein EDB91DRAFT_1064873 [Suillus paluster]KAG1720421.1 hypothetical protein EDB91DRAFT_1064873 [Suillus paluster]